MLTLEMQKLCIFLILIHFSMINLEYQEYTFNGKNKYIVYLLLYCFYDIQNYHRTNVKEFKSRLHNVNIHRKF